jgi:poly(hydroxyalkanoate) depolymerase family esterase
MRTARNALASLAVALAVGGLAIVVPALTRPAAAASLTEVTNFGNNPGGMRMHIYVPDVRPANPAIVVAMHGCGGSGPGFYSGSEFASQADRFGFIVIYPSATQNAGFGNCFDTWSEAAKRRGGGSDPVSIASMVTYAQQQHQGDPNRVYATGSSSGGMMTQHMLAVYPDVFKAGASFMGVPFNCFANAADYPPGSSQCTGGNMNRTPQQWGDAVRQAYPGYTGARPRVQLWHGTNDTLVPFSLLQESIDQWTNVAGLSQTPTSSDTPQANWNRRRFADTSGTVRVEAYSIQGAGHSLPSGGMAAQAVAFFGLNGTNPTTPPVTPPPTTPPVTPPISPTTNPPPTSQPPPPGGCTSTVSLNQWQGGFVATVRVTAGSSPITGWRVSMTLPSGATIVNAWNAQRSGNSGAVQFTNVSYNGRVGAGQTTEFGFQGTGTGPGNTSTCAAA